MIVRKIILFVFLPAFSFAQHFSDSLLTAFYNKTLLYYFADTTTNKDQVKFGCILIKSSIDTANLVKQVGKNKFRFMDKKSDLHEFLSQPFQKNNGRTFYWINHKSPARDTVDVNVEGYTIDRFDQRQLSFHAWKHGAMGYIPDGRFIYQKEANEWMFLSGEEISSEKMNEPVK